MLFAPTVEMMEGISIIAMLVVFVHFALFGLLAICREFPYFPLWGTGFALCVIGVITCIQWVIR